jgi:hypothetical protein
MARIRAGHRRVREKFATSGVMPMTPSLSEDGTLTTRIGKALALIGDSMRFHITMLAVLAAVALSSAPAHASPRLLTCGADCGLALPGHWQGPA